MNSLLVVLAASALYGAAPILLAALGGILSERSGVPNIGLEGMMLAGAFTAIWAAGTGPVPAVLAAAACGAVVGLLHALFTQLARIDAVVSGLGINLAASGITHFLAQRLWPQGEAVPTVARAWFLVAALLFTAAIAWFLSSSRAGLQLRACGESPRRAAVLGVRPLLVRGAAVTAGGALAAIGGAGLSLADAGRFSPDMSAGKGYLALAAVLFGRWRPAGAAGAAVLFGLAYAVQTQAQISGAHLWVAGVELTSPILLDALPYAVTLAALAFRSGRSGAPPALVASAGGTAV